MLNQATVALLRSRLSARSSVAKNPKLEALASIQYGQNRENPDHQNRE